jgi:hypothetical protein
MHARLLALSIVLAAFASHQLAFAQAEVEIRPDVVYGHKDGLAMTFDVFAPRPTAK